MGVRFRRGASVSEGGFLKLAPVGVSNGAQEKVYASIMKGFRTVREISEDTGLNDKAVRNALQKLAAQRKVHRVGQGKYHSDALAFEVPVSACLLEQVWRRA